jgi:hypothetical protein
MGAAPTYSPQGDRVPASRVSACLHFPGGQTFGITTAIALRFSDACHRLRSAPACQLLTSHGSQRTLLFLSTSVGCAPMDFIERIFGFAPDGGSGAFEFILFLVPLVGVCYLALVRMRRAARREVDRKARLGGDLVGRRDPTQGPASPP